MRPFHVVTLVMMAMGFSHSASADQCNAFQTPKAMSFRAIAAKVQLKEGAAVMDRPDGKALALVQQTSSVSASGVSTDGCWWEIVLPNGVSDM